MYVSVSLGTRRQIRNSTSLLRTIPVHRDAARPNGPPAVSSSAETRLDTNQENMYIHLIVMTIHDDHSSNALFALPCACQNLRRVSRLVTRIYAQDLPKAATEITHSALPPPLPTAATA